MGYHSLATINGKTQFPSTSVIQLDRGLFYRRTLISDQKTYTRVDQDLLDKDLIHSFKVQP